MGKQKKKPNEDYQDCIKGLSDQFGDFPTSQRWNNLNIKKNKCNGLKHATYDF